MCSDKSTNIDAFTVQDNIYLQKSVALVFRLDSNHLNLKDNEENSIYWSSLFSLTQFRILCYNFISSGASWYGAYVI